VALPHFLCKNLISRILKNLDLLWKRTAKESKFLISSFCPEDDGEPNLWLSRRNCAQQYDDTRVSQPGGTWESFSVCHARLSVEKSLVAPLRVRPVRSSELLSTVSARDPQIRGRISPDAALESYHRQKKRSVSLLTQPPSLAHVALEVERKRQKSPAMYHTILSIRIKREI